MKTHLSLPTRNLDQSVAFYETLFQAKPFKRRAEYALFVVHNPGLELALVRRARVRIDSSSHFGLAADDSNVVDEAVSRFAAAGIAADVEREHNRCYATQHQG